MIRLCQDLPEYTLTAKEVKLWGTIEERENIFFSAFLNKGYLLYKYIFFQK